MFCALKCIDSVFFCQLYFLLFYWEVWQKCYMFHFVAGNKMLYFFIQTWVLQVFCGLISFQHPLTFKTVWSMYYKTNWHLKLSIFNRHRTHMLVICIIKSPFMHVLTPQIVQVLINHEHKCHSSLSHYQLCSWSEWNG